MVVEDYLRELAARVAALAGGELVGVYAGGSYALGGYDPGVSDLDVAAVVRPAPTRALEHAIVAAIRHEALPCPARGLELVLYRLEATREPTTAAAFELDLNSGAEMTFRADLRPRAGEAHWYPIDRSILAQHGIALVGAPADEVFRPIPTPQLLPLLVESLRWHRRHPAVGVDAVLNACRALRYCAEGVWSSKPDAGAWALERVQDPSLVQAALDARSGGRALEGARVARFLDAAATLIADRARPEVG